MRIGMVYSNGMAIPDYHKALVESLASALAADNPRFDRAKFIEACIPQQVPKATQ